MPLGAARFGLLGGVADLGKLELIETQTYSSAVSFVDFTSIQESTYNVHFMTFSQMSGATDNTATINIRFYESGVLETASVYQVAIQGGRADGTFSEYKSTASGNGVAHIGSGIDNASSSSANGYCYFYNCKSCTK